MKTTRQPFTFFRAARAALQWRLLVLWAGLLLVPTLVMALPFWRLLGGALDHSVHATALASHLDALNAFDLVAVFKRESGMLGTVGVLSLVLTLALSPLLSGMAVTAARAAQPLGFGRLITGAFAEYGRMVRMLVWSAIPLGAAVALGGWIMDLIDKHNQAAIVADDAARTGKLGIAAALIVFAFAHATVDAGRAVLAAAPRRTSAVKAWWAGLMLVLRRPVATLGSWLVLGLIGLALAAVLGLLRLQLPPLGAGAILLGFIVTQAAALCLAWSRQARLFVLVAQIAHPSPTVRAASDVTAHKSSMSPAGR